MIDRRILGAALVVLLGCAGPGQLRRAERELGGMTAFDASNTALGDRGQKAWAAHLWASTSSEHQPVCAPKRYVPAEKPRGLVILYHGFTACPDQFDDLGPRLAAEGYEVLVPLLPGHGRVKPPKATSEKLVDDISAVPTRDDWQRYASFAEGWADVLADASGEHVVVGFSLGGTVAAQTIAARPTDVDRALIVAPFLSVSNTFAKMLLGVAAGVDALLTANPIDPMEHHWGESCEVEREKGRGGYCSFIVNNIAAAQIAGTDVRKRLAQTERLPPIQLVVIEEDNAVDTPLAVDTLRQLQPRSADARWCTFARTVPHSFFSPKDRPGEPSPWLPDFTPATVELIARGTLFEVGPCPGNPR